MTQQGTSFRYDAFISYRHKELDRKWAQWLLESLETYKVPQSLVKQGFAPRIQRVFRDEDELPTSADLGENIRLALEASLRDGHRRRHHPALPGHVQRVAGADRLRVRPERRGRVRRADLTTDRDARARARRRRSAPPRSHPRTPGACAARRRRR